ncbi:TetR/AcrR family transcriptional regulator [Actinoplanes sp. NPDC026670]|uniref:TetR/AcrR family transcriptional regulator n=1 Tax=Actinoplanes sp. NPDC026670 TaxID=3154700 RepID=UPI0033E27559
MPNRDSGEKQTRRRGLVLEEAILDAAWTELAERGWSGFTVEGVATRSGAAKSVIYRRWSGRVELAQALLARAQATALGTLQSRGDLRTDLLTILQDMTRFMRGPFGDASRGIAIEGDPSQHASVFSGKILVAAVGELIEQARARGEITGSPSSLALNIGHAVVMWEFTHTRRPPTSDDLAQLVDTIWLPAIRHSST